MKSILSPLVAPLWQQSWHHDNSPFFMDMHVFGSSCTQQDISADDVDIRRVQQQTSILDQQIQWPVAAFTNMV